MRYHELTERSHGDLSRSEVSKLIRKMINKTGEDAWEINNGWCWGFANRLAKELGPEAKVVNSTSDFKDGTFPGHSWVLYKGFHFDAESPFGEKEPKQMQYHRRLRAIADSPEGSDEQEVVRKELGHDPVYLRKHVHK